MGSPGRLKYQLARPALFALDPERAHELTLTALDALGGGRPFSPLARALVAAPRVSDPVELLGLTFPNRVGLGAGLDKDARHIDGLAALGFGFLELGTVTPLPQPGNPKPRLFRLPQADALINRFGFNNLGIDAFIAAVTASRTWRRRQFRPLSGSAGEPVPILGINIGKNAATPIERAVDDYLIGLRRAWPVADYITINVSSPNTANLRQLQAADELSNLLAALADERQRLARDQLRPVPLLLKVAPDLDDAQIEIIAATLPRHGIDGVIATNTTLERTAVAHLPHGGEAGGLSGRPVMAGSNRVIRALRDRLPSGFPIIGIGGIQDANDAIAKLDHGADLVQLYTGLIYQGPALIHECAEALRRERPRPPVA